LENTPTAVLYITAIAAIIGALFAGAGLFIQKKISWQRSVEQVAVFRQNWINELRNSMAEFQGIATGAKDSPHLAEKFYELGTRIELLMNKNDDDYRALQDLLYEYLHTSLKNRNNTDHLAKLEDSFSINPEFVEVCQRILKREWERLKSDIKTQKI